MDRPLLSMLEDCRKYFNSGATKEPVFRQRQLQVLKAAILKNENELHAALFTDLRKTPEESWVTETGFVVAEINHTLRHIKKWMKPERVATNLLNFPGTSYIYKEPLGVVLVIGPWNYPIQLLLVPLLGAMAAGNCAVVKPSESAPATSAMIKKILAENFPPEYILCMEGPGSEVVPSMMKPFRFDHVFYTGSSRFGRMVYEMAASQLAPVTLELGGKSPCVVEADANIRVAAKRIALTKFSNAGQMCVAPDYLLVHDSVRDSMVDELKKNIRGFFGDDASKSEDYGRIIDKKHFTRLRSYLDQGRILSGGSHNADSLYMEPTLIGDIPEDAAIMGEEIFGPVLPVLSFAHTDEAMAIINRNPDPLALYVFTGSRKKASHWIREIPFGGGCINNASWHLTNFYLPFGGRGRSGFGSYHGKYSFDTFSHFKSIMKTPTWFDPGIRYPPFKGKLNLFKKLIR